MTNSERPNFLRIFSAHRECCRRMLKLSQQQIELIEHDEYTGLLTILGKKQQLIIQLEEFGKHRPRIKELWNANRDSLDAESRQECESILRETETFLANVVAEEQTSTTTLEKRRRAVQQDIKNIATGERVNEAYLESLAPATHRRLDIGQ